MNTNPLVSIITVCWNSEKTIERTIKSVMVQTYGNIEYIIVDGASTDQTVSIAEKYQQVAGFTITIISEPDDGIYDAMNKGINAAHGDIIGILNSDDWYEADAVERSVKAICDSGEDKCVSYGDMRFWSPDGMSKTLHRPYTELERDMIFHPTCFVTKETYSEYGGFNQDYRLAADYELMLRLYKKGVTFVDNGGTIANFSLEGASASVKCSLEVVEIKYRNGLISSGVRLRKRMALIIQDKLGIRNSVI